MSFLTSFRSVLIVVYFLKKIEIGNKACKYLAGMTNNLLMLRVARTEILSDLGLHGQVYCSVSAGAGFARAEIDLGLWVHCIDK